MYMHMVFAYHTLEDQGHGYTSDTTVLIETSPNKKRHKKLKRRSSIEPVFSHTKQHHRTGRNFLKGEEGNLINTILSACGYTLKKIYNTFKKAYKKILSLLLFMLLGDCQYPKAIVVPLGSQEETLWVKNL